jgi:hypothetical protein
MYYGDYVCDKDVFLSCLWTALNERQGKIMYGHRRRFLNYRLIGLMFWAFPYLLWQTFGHISGLFVGVVLAVILTMMFQTFVRRGSWNGASSNQQFVQMSELQSHNQVLADQPSQEEILRPYQSGYQAELGPSREEQTYQVGPSQAQYDEMQVQYPQEMPPIEQ